ncbi:cell division protein ZipA C-terminal FtsZ-binding domain-containing protein [Legionella fairfieldensis]|uniref:cell division protein ZipA C-terminal FtsZ-binding domain-containing protein n=1 Tax=Legionella fairfieldensis TaxID=45064 RepID=UPI00048E24EB|nr:cell division protein ZipA C-terminal FtsZ-binding domain-containing protein [Legionella fairfieldensis]
MQANWSLILNVLLLMGVVIAIGRLMKARRRSLTPPALSPSLGIAEGKPFDEIIAVRKVNYDSQNESSDANDARAKTPSHKAEIRGESQRQYNSPLDAENGKPLMMFLSAKENRQLAGYELLQTVLAAGLRFGEGQLFHRHQYANGQGPVLCSLAAATPSGTFDLQNIGGFSVRGLCLFMQASGNPTIDAERFHIMYETAKQLSDGLDTYLLDEQKRPLSENSLAYYRSVLNIQEDEVA